MSTPQTWNVADAFDIGAAVSTGIEALKRQPVGLLLGSFLLTITDGGGGSGGNGGSSSYGDDGGLGGQISDALGSLGGAEAAMIAALFGCLLCCGIGIFLFRSWLEPGYLRLHRDLIVTGAGEVGALFGGGDVFARVALWKLLSAVIGLGTLVVALLPGGAVLGAGVAMDESSGVMITGGVLMALIGLPALIYVELGLWMGSRAVALDGLAPMDALERSWAMARGNRVHLAIFYVVTSVFTLLGFIACCVGVFATRAITDVGTTRGYLVATRPEQAPGFALNQAR